MNSLFIPFYFTPGARGITMRELTGADESSAGENNTAGVLSLLEPLIIKETAPEGFHANRIVTADRDRLIARLYISLYGTKIASTLACEGCQEKFDLDFSLDDLLAHFHPGQVQIPEDGIYEAGPGIRFRLPAGADELATSGYDAKTAEKMMLERCLISGDPETDGKTVQLKMADIAPLLSQEMNAVCPECSQVQKVLFDMQSFFMTRFLRERQDLEEEVHLIASRYHWSHQEIVSLPRSLRKKYAALINAN
ncbi:MAG: hypothetical protein WCO44_05760 [Bacteroidota bacterium]